MAPDPAHPLQLLQLVLHRRQRNTDLVSDLPHRRREAVLGVETTDGVEDPPALNGQ
jgi:hypothetical protein